MESYDGITTAYEAYLRGAKLSGKMKVNRTQIRTFLTNDVTICCHDNKSVTYIQFYHTINLSKFHLHTFNSFRNSNR